MYDIKPGNDLFRAERYRLERDVGGRLCIELLEHLNAETKERFIARPVKFLDTSMAKPQFIVRKESAIEAVSECLALVQSAEYSELFESGDADPA